MTPLQALNKSLDVGELQELAVASGVGLSLECGRSLDGDLGNMTNEIFVN